MMRWREWTIGNRVALLILSIAAGSAGVVLVRSWQIVPLPVVTARYERPTLPPAAADTNQAKSPLEAVLRAVARDPFRPDRQRPPGRYRLPGERRLARKRAREVARRPDVRVFGTAARPGGRGVAALELSGNPPRALSVGDTLGEWTLVRVGHGRVMLAGYDTVITLKVQRPLRTARRQE